MFILDSLLINGIKFALDKVPQVVDQEMDNPEALQQQLLEAQMQLEEGTIDEETFAEIERDIFARIREMKGNEVSGGIADASASRTSKSKYPTTKLRESSSLRGFVTDVHGGSFTNVGSRTRGQNHPEPT